MLVFLILQYFGANPELDDEPWDPKSLPEINPEEDVKRWELILGLVGSVLLLVLVTVFPQWVGFVTAPGGEFYPNPVILEHLPLIRVNLAAWIAYNVYMLWKRRQDPITKVISLGLNFFNVSVLSILVVGHNRWLGARSSGGFLDAIEAIPGTVGAGWELVGMHAFRLAFVVALIVTVLEIIKGVYQLVRSALTRDFQPQI